MPALFLLFSTFASEDLACVAAAAMIARGDLSAVAAVAACTTGIFLGDVGLWAAGRLAGRFARGSAWIERHVSRVRLEECRQWLDRHAGTAILASRFTPGARLPLYLAAGLVRLSPWRFAAWALTAAVVWTPAVVLASARAGHAVAGAGSMPIWTIPVAAGAVLLLSRVAISVTSWSVRRARAALGPRLTRWEFWPPWLFYAPVAIWVVLLAIRHRGLTTITTSNPGIPDGGIVGESKYEILRRLPRDCTIPSARIAAVGGCDPVAHTLLVMKDAEWTFPVVLKPDVGQRGVGVRLIRTIRELRAYLSAASGDVLVQPFHPGPFEAGVFYVRLPGQVQGRIFSITDKVFPVVTGDGQSTVSELIDAHPRYRLQAGLFKRRHQRLADAVLGRGARLQLALAGNHAQGTTFLDGAHLWTAALERRIDEVAQHYAGFFIGRFDIRYSDVEQFKAGRDLAIVELNGATSESTNIYDPHTPLTAAYRTLFRQWSMVFAIGAANRARGAVPTPAGRLARLVWVHLTARTELALAD